MTCSPCSAPLAKPVDEPALLVLWERVVGDLLDRTAKFPKVVRFTFAGRIDGIVLDFLERIAEARWAPAPRKRVLLAEADLLLVRLHVLLRLAHDRRYLDTGGFEHVVRGVDEAGRMLGGWRKHIESRP